VNNQELIITREFNAPITLVWEMFSTAEHLSQWWGPKGFSTTVKAFTFEVGGTFHYGLIGPDASIMWGIFHYKAINKPTKLAFTNGFSNESGELVQAPEIPFGKDWPLEIMNSIQFTEQDAKTHMEMRSFPVDATPEAIQTFTENIQNMQMGFKGTFDNLELHLKSFE